MFNTKFVTSISKSSPINAKGDYNFLYKFGDNNYNDDDGFRKWERTKYSISNISFAQAIEIRKFLLFGVSMNIWNGRRSYLNVDEHYDYIRNSSSFYETGNREQHDFKN